MFATKKSGLYLYLSLYFSFSSYEEGEAGAAAAMSTLKLEGGAPVSLQKHVCIATLADVFLPTSNQMLLIYM